MEVQLAEGQAHYLLNVLRLRPGDPVRLFNGRDGEWLSFLTEAGRKVAAVRVERQSSQVAPPPDVDFCFAPLKHARLDYLIQKATEIGARRLLPVISQRTIVDRVNVDRMRANAIEAAEQCNLVYVPDVLPPQRLEALISDWSPNRALVYCDESAEVSSPLAAMQRISLPAAILVGPEGGFTHEERQLLRSHAWVMPVSLGPRILRADTAGMSALTLLQATLGDWR